eukprot:gene3135-3603_t
MKMILRSKSSSAGHMTRQSFGFALICFVIVILTLVSPGVDGWRRRRRRCSPKSCIVSQWTAWTACSKSCGGGTMTRSRTVMRAESCGGACRQRLSGLMYCNFKSCPVDCVWNWSSWGTCQGCGSSSQVRRAVVSIPARYGGSACPSVDNSTQSQRCDTGSHCHSTIGRAEPTDSIQSYHHKQPHIADTNRRGEVESSAFACVRRKVERDCKLQLFNIYDWQAKLMTSIVGGFLDEGVADVLQPTAMFQAGQVGLRAAKRVGPLVHRHAIAVSLVLLVVAEAAIIWMKGEHVIVAVARSIVDGIGIIGVLAKAVAEAHVREA